MSSWVLSSSSLIYEMDRRQKIGEKEKLNIDASESALSRAVMYLFRANVTGGDSKQPRAFGSEVFRARERQTQLQTSMRKPLKWLT